MPDDITRGDAEISDAEIRHLRSSINDLISLQALPAIWDGRKPCSIVSTLLDALGSMLRLDFAYVRLNDSFNESPVEFLQLGQRRAPSPQASEIVRALDRRLTNQSVDAPLAVPNPAGDGEVKIAPFRLGVTDEIGVLVAGSKRTTFPTPTETLLLRMAANQALVALQEARQLHEEKRAAQELERRVADRTAQLTSANDALRESEKKYRTLFDANIIGILIWNLDGQVLEANDAFLRLVGYDREDLRSGRINWWELTPPEWSDRDKNQWVPEMKKSGFLQPFEKEYFRKDGSRVPVLIGVASFDEDGSQGVAFVLDLSERKRAEEALRNAQAALTHMTRVTTMGEVSASIAHELNQPLTAIVNNANACLDLLPNERTGLTEVRVALTDMVSDAERASAIIERVRRMARRSAPERAPLQLADVVDDTMDLAMSAAISKRVKIHAEVSADLPLVVGDRVQLQQVLLNLVLNAMEAMASVEEPERRIEIVGRPDTHDGYAGVRLDVRDCGTGLHSVEMDRLFEAFYTTKSHGMGLGLAISRSIIEAHGGRLWAESNNGPGATFSFSLPVASNVK